MVTKQISFPVSEKIHQDAKIRSIREKMDLRDWIIGLMKKELYGEKKKNVEQPKAF